MNMKIKKKDIEDKMTHKKQVYLELILWFKISYLPIIINHKL